MGCWGEGERRVSKGYSDEKGGLRGAMNKLWILVRDREGEYW